MLSPPRAAYARTFACPSRLAYDVDGAAARRAYPGGYAALDKSEYGLEAAPRVSSYRGFVFASFAATASRSSSTSRRDAADRPLVRSLAHREIS